METKADGLFLRRGSVVQAAAQFQRRDAHNRGIIHDLGGWRVPRAANCREAAALTTT
jgi:hypothetical protein